MSETGQIAPSDPLVEWDPLAQADDPYPLYRKLRDEAPLSLPPISRRLGVLAVR
jgi:hypothetical protein